MKKLTRKIKGLFARIKFKKIMRYRGVLLEGRIHVPIMISNCSITEDVEVILFGWNEDTPGIIRDGNTEFKGLVNGQEQAVASITSKILDKHTDIREFLFAIRHFGLMVKTLRVSSSTSEQMLHSMHFERFNPFDKSTEDVLRLQDYVKEDSVNDKILTIKRAFILNKYKKMSIIIPKAVSADKPTRTAIILAGDKINTSKKIIKN